MRNSTIYTGDKNILEIVSRLGKFISKLLFLQAVIYKVRCDVSICFGLYKS